MNLTAGEQLALFRKAQSELPPDQTATCTKCGKTILVNHWLTATTRFVKGISDNCWGANHKRCKGCECPCHREPPPPKPWFPWEKY